MPEPRKRNWLTHGSNFWVRTDAALANGITEPGTRHDLALKLAWRFRVAEGCSNDETLERLKAWLLAHPHDGTPLAADPAQLVHTTLREVKHYLTKHLTAFERPPSLEEHELEQLLEPIRADVRREAKLIVERCVGKRTYTLSSGYLRKLCGGRRIRCGKSRRVAYVIAIEQLCAAGILSLRTKHSTGRHGRIYWVHITRFLKSRAPLETTSQSPPSSPALGSSPTSPA